MTSVPFKDLMDVLPDAEIVAGTVNHGIRETRATIGEVVGDLVVLSEEGTARYAAAFEAVAKAAVKASKEKASKEKAPKEKAPAADAGQSTDDTKPAEGGEGGEGGEPEE